MTYDEADTPWPNDQGSCEVCGHVLDDWGDCMQCHAEMAQDLAEMEERNG